jgi:DNA damage-binding protein 1
MGDGVNGAAKFCAVGMWTTEHSVAVYGLPGLNLVTTQSLDGAFTPRSVAIASLEGVDHLLIGQGDGRLYDFTIEMGEGNFTLMDKRIVALGTQPITLTSYQVTGDQRHVFAGCDRPTVIYGSKKKLLYSQVNLKEVSNMCSFNSEDFPYSMAVISEEQLKIGTIDQIQKLHIKTIDLHEMARRIAHQEQSKTFGILTVKTTRDATTGDESESSYIKLLDNQTFEGGVPRKPKSNVLFSHSLYHSRGTYSVLDSVRMNDHEMAISILSYQIPGVGEGSPSTNVYVVGTAFADPAEDEPSRGRLMAFEVSASASGNDKALRLLSQLEITGAAYCLAPLDGHVAAGVNNKVYVYRLDIGDDGNCSLVQVCGHHGMVVAVCMASRGPYLLVGDLMKSVSLLMWKSEQKALELVARDPDMNWMLATEMLDEEVFIGADNCFNLFTLRRNAGATKDEERKRLEPVGEFHLGGQVNKFQKGWRQGVLFFTSKPAHSIFPQTYYQDPSS